MVKRSRHIPNIKKCCLDFSHFSPEGNASQSMGNWGSGQLSVCGQPQDWREKVVVPTDEAATGPAAGQPPPPHLWNLKSRSSASELPTKGNSNKMLEERAALAVTTEKAGYTPMVKHKQSLIRKAPPTTLLQLQHLQSLLRAPDPRVRHQTKAACNSRASSDVLRIHGRFVSRDSAQL